MQINRMKDNEKSMLYISTFEFCFTSWPYPAYEILKP